MNRNMHDGHYVAFMGHGFRPIKSYTGILILIGLWHRRRRIACTPRQGVLLDSHPVTWSQVRAHGHTCLVDTIAMVTVGADQFGPFVYSHTGPVK